MTALLLSFSPLKSHWESHARSACFALLQGDDGPVASLRRPRQGRVAIQVGRAGGSPAGEQEQRGKVVAALGRGHQGRLAAKAARIGIGAVVEQPLDDRRVVGRGGCHERVVPPELVLGIDVGARRQQQLDHGRVATPRRSHQRRALLPAVGVAVGAALQQKPHDRLLIPVDGPHQRRPGGPVAGIDVGAAVEQQPHHGLAPLLRGRDQRRVLLRSAPGIDLGAVVQQQADELLVVPLHGARQGRPFARAILRIDVGADGDQPARRHGVASFNGQHQRCHASLIVDARVGTAAEQQLHHHRVILQDGSHQGRASVHAVPLVEAGVVLQQETNDGLLLLVTLRSPHERRPAAAPLLPVDVGAVPEELLNHCRVPCPGGHHQRCASAAPLLAIDIGAKLRDNGPVPALGSHHQRRPPIKPLPLVDVSAVAEQCLDCRAVASLRRPHQRRLSPEVLVVDLRRLLQQRLHDGFVALLRRKSQRPSPPVVLGLDVGAAIEQAPHNLQVSLPRRLAQRRLPRLVPGVDVDSMPDEQVRDALMALRRRPHQRGAAPAVLCVGIGAVAQQQLDHVLVASARGAVEQRAAEIVALGDLAAPEPPGVGGQRLVDKRLDPEVGSHVQPRHLPPRRRIVRSRLLGPAILLPPAQAQGRAVTEEGPRPLQDLVGMLLRLPRVLWPVHDGIVLERRWALRLTLLQAAQAVAGELEVRLLGPDAKRLGDAQQIVPGRLVDEVDGAVVDSQQLLAAGHLLAARLEAANEVSRPIAAARQPSQPLELFKPQRAHRRGDPA
ncbi:LOW QUALITY PROTEIN: hypothetical protein MKX08_009082 [Trichoderma sp. CBMAI-0020]|nr:LOW QUALITY PROTEIN: hypothetical protein MKX08_009082 [Trichoderma sp. CBMAI-0020]